METWFREILFAEVAFHWRTEAVLEVWGGLYEADAGPTLSLNNCQVRVSGFLPNFVCLSRDMIRYETWIFKLLKLKAELC